MNKIQKENKKKQKGKKGRRGRKTRKREGKKENKKGRNTSICKCKAIQKDGSRTPPSCCPGQPWLKALQKPWCWGWQWLQPGLGSVRMDTWHVGQSGGPLWPTVGKGAAMAGLAGTI